MNAHKSVEVENNMNSCDWGYMKTDDDNHIVAIVHC